jgi:hypothetical protein
MRVGESPPRCGVPTHSNAMGFAAILFHVKDTQLAWELLLLLAATLFQPINSYANPIIPTGPVPAGDGVNIHFTHAKPGEMKLLAYSGITWIRMDFVWEAIEKKPGVYDFSNYDFLMHDLDANHIHPLFILDYGNPLYEKDSPSTDAARTAFAKFAAAAVNHFANRGAIWEIWNEPNGGFWKPKANVDDYAKLALVTGKAIHEAQPDEVYVGPGTSGIDLKFCEGCFKAGCLADWSAVSVHPYRQGGPESAVEGYKKLADSISKYAPAGKIVPILSGEWGWSTGWKKMTPELQADYLARQWLINQWQHVPISIYYDWHDDGTNPKDPEHHFGIVDNAYQPKPAYRAAKTFTMQLNGFSFDRRLATERGEDYLLLFTRANDARMVVWTTSKQQTIVKIAAPDGDVTGFSVVGEALPKMQAVGGALALPATSSPQYLIPVGASKGFYERK